MAKKRREFCLPTPISRRFIIILNNGEPVRYFQYLSNGETMEPVKMFTRYSDAKQFVTDNYLHNVRIFELTKPEEESNG